MESGDLQVGAGFGTSGWGSIIPGDCPNAGEIKNNRNIMNFFLIERMHLIEDLSNPILDGRNRSGLLILLDGPI